MSATYAVSGFSRAPGRGYAGDLVARLGEKVQRLLNPSWLLFRSSDTVDELLVARNGPVEIRQTLASWTLETRVKGEPDRARATALQRLGNYVNGRNRGGTRLRVARPLVQAEEAAGRWHIRIALPGMDDDFAAATKRNGKVRLRALESETLAVIRVPGRPTKLAIQHAETAIRHAIAPTRWAATGGPMLRLHALRAVLPFLGRFEVAVPVADRTHGSAMPDWMRRAAFDHPAAQETPTQAPPRAR
jgi:hypothetical protein